MFQIRKMIQLNCLTIVNERIAIIGPEHRDKTKNKHLDQKICVCMYVFLPLYTEPCEMPLFT